MNPLITPHNYSKVLTLYNKRNMHGWKNICSLSIANNKEFALNKIVRGHLVSKLIQPIVLYVMSNFARFAIINSIKDNAIKMV